MTVHIKKTTHFNEPMECHFILMSKT